MKLLRLKLEDWGGVSEREVQFSDGVTLIEGPNEVGKTTIVEAVKLLFNEMDSSNKHGVKSIQPMGEDVGSTVEAEVQTGDYHFVYSKTYNKNKQTRLDILAPTKLQLTGREAHEKVREMLSDTVDLDLWSALLVDQGKEVALANLQDSSGLANALDEAAGSTANSSEDSDLYRSIQAEYEKYFTLKNRKPRFESERTASQQADSDLAVAKAELEEVETDADSQKRSASEILRLKSSMPELKEKVQEYEASWNLIQSVHEKLAVKGQELESAQTIHEGALDTLTKRKDLVADINLDLQGHEDATRSIEPLREQVKTLGDQLDKKRIIVKELKQNAKTTRAKFDQAQADERHLQNLKILKRDQSRLEELTEIASSMKSELEARDTIAIDNQGLEQFRKADTALTLAQNHRDFAAATVSVKALNELDLEIDGEKVPLKKSNSITRSMASVLHLHLPGVAEIDITPSHSMGDLQEEVETAETELLALEKLYGVTNVTQATKDLEKKSVAQREIDKLKLRENNILDGDNLAEITQSVSSLKLICDSYEKQREAETDLPGDVATATQLVNETRSAFESEDEKLELAQFSLDSLQEEHDSEDDRMRLAEQDLAGLTSALADKRKRLEREQKIENDESLGQRVAEALKVVEALGSKLQELSDTLEQSNPEVVEAQLENAQAVLTRANSDLAQEEEDHAVLTDRLQRAQADGRYETFEQAERKSVQCAAKLESTLRRAAAVELLWDTINSYRDKARLAYVQPLKQAIERLGTIVFGNSFEIAIADDWKLESRTLNGKTLPFDVLSIGAKEQLGIITRLAAAQIVSTQGGVPLIIDDALGFSDPGKLEAMGAAIAAAGKQCQIIILTCTPGRFTHVGSASVVKF